MFCIAFSSRWDRSCKEVCAGEWGSNKEHDEFYKSAGISREQVWIQHSPLGSGSPDLEIVSIETNDPGQTFKEFTTSNHPWAVKFREFAKSPYGIDFIGPPPPLKYC